MTLLQQIRVFAVQSDPPLWTICWVMEELQLPYKVEPVCPEVPKRYPPGPSGRVTLPKRPGLVFKDPNTDLTLFCSNAILTYLVEQYDTKRQHLSFTSLPEKQYVNQWVHLQVRLQEALLSAAWFLCMHHEILPSAYEYWRERVRGGLGSLEHRLQDRDWIIGDKMTIADMAFVGMNEIAHLSLGELNLPPKERITPCAYADKFKGFPRVQAWHERMVALPSWKAARAKWDADIEKRAQRAIAEYTEKVEAAQAA